MKPLKKKSSVILYACSGLGVNMLNVIVGSYLCSALLVGGFEKHVENWTYLNKDLVVAGLWAVLIVVAKIMDGLIDLPLSHFVDNLQSKWGKRKTAIVMGFFPMITAYCLFLIPINTTATYLNTIWFGFLLLVYYTSYTLTMITYYATFAEVSKGPEDIVLLSNTKSICDVVYFSLGFALVPAFVSMGLNIRIVALMFLPLALTMMIPIFLLKENSENADKKAKADRTKFKDSLMFTLKDKPYILWLCTLFVMNIGLQLFLSGINEYFSTSGLNMTFVMASCFVPVPATIILYNKILKKHGLGFAFRYILIVFSVGMALMGLIEFIPENLMYPYAIGCSIIVSFSIGAFFSITYTVPSARAATRKELNSDTASSMYYAIQGLFEGTSAGIASGVILVTFKQNGLVPIMTVCVAAVCMAAFCMSFMLPNAISKIGKADEL
ncbi:MAG: hypothetical protein E7566_02850 [Ruminococcaceae bacterium]|nr:hypothetical protein [Oscillospiraceae bacterium]